jgi:hypothetical protein
MATERFGALVEACSSRPTWADLDDPDAVIDAGSAVVSGNAWAQLDLSPWSPSWSRR